MTSSPKTSLSPKSFRYFLKPRRRPQSTPHPFLRTNTPKSQLTCCQCFLICDSQTQRSTLHSLGYLRVGVDTREVGWGGVAFLSSCQLPTFVNIVSSLSVVSPVNDSQKSLHRQGKNIPPFPLGNIRYIKNIGTMSLPTLLFIFILLLLLLLLSWRKKLAETSVLLIMNLTVLINLSIC